MDKQRRKSWFGLGSTCFICFFLVAALSVDGCEPLRKKFTRKKKKENVENEAVPILEPIDYPAKVYSPSETYQHHYSLRQVWHNELLNLILEKGYDKRKLYLIDQVILNTQAMQNLLVEEGQASLAGSLEELRKVKADLEDPVPTRNLSALKRELILIDKDIREDYKFSAIEGVLKK